VYNIFRLEFKVNITRRDTLYTRYALNVYCIGQVALQEHANSSHRTGLCHTDG